MTVSEDEIVDATSRLAYEARLVAEPSGTVTFVGYLYRRSELPSTRLNAAIISGGNAEPGMLAQILAISDR